MERLTHRCDLGLSEFEEIAYINPLDQDGHYNILDLARYYSFDHDGQALCTLANISEKLADYEDICPEPERLKEIDALYLDKCREVTAFKEQHRWIPVEERPPEEDADYLVTMVTPGFLNGQPYTNWLCWCCDDQEWTDTDGAAMPEQDKVVAWRPILKPYQPETIHEAGQEAGDGGLMPAT